MATLISKPKIKNKKFKVGDKVSFLRPFILQNIGTSYEITPARIVKVNPKTYHIKDKDDYVWKVDHNEVWLMNLEDVVVDKPKKYKQSKPEVDDKGWTTINFLEH